MPYDPVLNDAQADANLIDAEHRIAAAAAACAGPDPFGPEARDWVAATLAGVAAALAAVRVYRAARFRAEIAAGTLAVTTS